MKKIIWYHRNDIWLWLEWGIMGGQINLCYTILMLSFSELWCTTCISKIKTIDKPPPVLPLAATGAHLSWVTGVQLGRQAGSQAGTDVGLWFHNLLPTVILLLVVLCSFVTAALVPGMGGKKIVSQSVGLFVL